MKNLPLVRFVAIANTGVDATVGTSLKQCRNTRGFKGQHMHG